MHLSSHTYDSSDHHNQFVNLMAVYSPHILYSEWDVWVALPPTRETKGRVTIFRVGTRLVWMPCYTITLAISLYIFRREAEILCTNKIWGGIKSQPDRWAGAQIWPSKKKFHIDSPSLWDFHMVSYVFTSKSTVGGATGSPAMWSRKQTATFSLHVFLLMLIILVWGFVWKRRQCFSFHRT